MSLAFEVSTVLNVPPDVLYNAWLDSAQHTAMTGGVAEVSAQVGGEFSAWDGYIRGRNLELSSPRKIVQAWRTSEFEDSEADSRLEILFEPQDRGTRITLRHSELPAHGGQYEQGWVDNYFEPMRQYFEG